MALKERVAARDGMTLIEVLLAAVMLAIGLTVILTGISSCLAVMRTAKRFQEAQWVLGLGELAHPMKETEDVMEDVPVSADSGLRDGYTFEREIEDDDDEDGLYVVSTRVSWGKGGPGSFEEVVQYVFQEVDE